MEEKSRQCEIKPNCSLSEPSTSAAAIVLILPQCEVQDIDLALLAIVCTQQRLSLRIPTQPAAGPKLGAMCKIRTLPDTMYFPVSVAETGSGGAWPRMSLLYGPTHRKCLCGLLESTLTRKQPPVSGVGLLKEERMNWVWSIGTLVETVASFSV